MQRNLIFSSEGDTIWILTFSDSDYFCNMEIPTFSDSDYFRDMTIPTFSDSNHFRDMQFRLFPVFELKKPIFSWNKFQLFPALALLYSNIFLLLSQVIPTFSGKHAAWFRPIPVMTDSDFFRFRLFLFRHFTRPPTCVSVTETTACGTRWQSFTFTKKALHSWELREINFVLF